MTRQFPDDELWQIDMDYAFEQAACCIEDAEYGGTYDHVEYARQEAAFQEVAKRIRAMGKRYNARCLKKKLGGAK